MTTMFESKSDLAAYFDSDELVCLMCGRPFVQLVAHVGPAHRMTADEYKHRFGIPWTYGLAGKAFKAKSSRRIKSTREAGKLAAQPSETHVARLIEAARTRRKNVAAVSSDNRRKVLSAHKQLRITPMLEFNDFLSGITDVSKADRS